MSHRIRVIWRRILDEGRLPAGRGRAGQSLILFALANLIVMGGLALVLDIGYNINQRRAMQNAADAAALKGAQLIHANATAPVLTLPFEVKAMAMRNGLGDPDAAGSGATLDCRFVDNSDADLGACAGAIPATATGVRVSLTERHQTLAMRALGLAKSGTGATAMAHVHALAPATFTAGAGPFIACGWQTYLANGGTQSILVTDAAGKATNPPRIDPLAVNQTFVIHGPSVASCNTLGGNRFNGVADQDANAGLPIAPSGTTIKYNPGVAAGPMRKAVAGLNGCDTVTVTGCVMLLPIADTVYVDCGNCKQINAVGWGAFLVTQVDSNTHYGKLLSYELVEQSTKTWTKSQNQSAVVIHLTR